MDNKDVPIKTWMSVVQRPEAPPKCIRRRKCNRVIYPEFVAAADYYRPIDAFWADFLLACACGRFPKGFLFRDKVLSFGRGAKKRDYPLPDDVESLAKLCISLFRSVSLIHSPLDIELHDAEEENAIRQMREAPVEWTKIKTRSTRYNLLHEYVERKYAHLTPEHRHRIYMVVCIALEDGRVKGKHIHFTGNAIADIDGIVVTEDDCHCTNPYARTSKAKEIVPPLPKEYRHFENWCKYRNEILRLPNKGTSIAKSTDASELI